MQALYHARVKSSSVVTSPQPTDVGLTSTVEDHPRDDPNPFRVVVEDADAPHVATISSPHMCLGLCVVVGGVRCDVFHFLWLTGCVVVEQRC